MSKREVIECDGCNKDLTEWNKNDGIGLYPTLILRPRMNTPTFEDFEDKSPLHFCNLQCIRNWANGQE